MNQYIQIIKEYSRKTYKQMTREPDGALRYPFIVPGSSSYSNCLWDWDSWLTNVAVRQIMADNSDYDEDFIKCEKGCIFNFLDHIQEDGRVSIMVTPQSGTTWLEREGNIHKPCLAQHAAFIVKINHGDAEWLRPHMDKMQSYIDYYRSRCRHQETGLYFWIDDTAIGVDNDPCTFYRPKNSSASIYLNCLMYKELQAYVYIAELLGKNADVYANEILHLKNAVNKYLWDERNGFFYSADLNLLEINPNEWLHRGAPRHWHSVIQKIDVWSGFMAMWAGIADRDRAERMVRENMMNEEIFFANYGIRSLSKLEQMYVVKKSGNPSCWLGPVWGITNWMCFKSLIDYGYDTEAKQLAEKTITMFGKDILENGKMHEYYNPDTGVGINNPGFQNWNLLVNNMIAWFENREVITEF